MKQKFFHAFGLIALSVVSRVVPHPWNMTPVIGGATFAGVYLGKRWAILVPLLSMFVADLFLGFYNWQFLIVVYVSMIAAGLLAYATRNKDGVGIFLGRPIAASLLFFLTTNAAVCMFGTMYPHTTLGLVASYIFGLPFFGHQLLGDILYTSLFFGAYGWIKKVSAKRAQLAVV